MVVFTFSLAAHLVAYGGYEIGKSLHLSLPHFLTKKIAAIPLVQNQEPPLEFAMVQQPSTEAPKNAKYYGAQNSRAADQTHGDQNEAQINGTQTEIVKTEDATRTDFNKLQPQQPSPNEYHPTVEPGELTLAKAQEPQPQTRPRTLQQALAQNHLLGPQMKQNGGAHEFRAPSFDVKGSTFGAYDQAFIQAVTQRWYDLLDSQRFALDRTGKVVLRFHLHDDGRISDMTVLQNTVGELLGNVCADAIHDPAPYAVWPKEMRQTIGTTFREITFTFYYY